MSVKCIIALPKSQNYILRMQKHLDISSTIVIGALLTVVMLWPLNQSPPAPEGSDKVVHLIAFAALIFPLAQSKRFGHVIIFIGASVYGGVIELIQPSFNRSMDINDWIADMVGVAIGIGCGLLYSNSRRRYDVSRHKLLLVFIVIQTRFRDFLFDWDKCSDQSRLITSVDKIPKAALIKIKKFKIHGGSQFLVFKIRPQYDVVSSSRYTCKTSIVVSVI